MTALAPANLDGVFVTLFTARDEREVAPARDDRATRLADGDDVARTLAGDGEAFARIVRRYQPLLFRRMRRFSRDAGEVEQLVHDAFVEAYLSLPRYRSTAPLEHWLQRIATRVGYRFWTRRKRDAAPLPDRSAARATDDAAERRDEVERLRHAVERLSPRDRLVVTLLYLDGHSVAEAAQRSGWSQSMVKVQAFRARARLKKLLEGNDRP